jgi:hypothetical protein
MPRYSSASARSREEIDARIPPTSRSANAGNRRELALPIDNCHAEGGPREVATPEAHASDESAFFHPGRFFSRGGIPNAASRFFYSNSNPPPCHLIPNNGSVSRPPTPGQMHRPPDQTG